MWSSSLPEVGTTTGACQKVVYFRTIQSLWQWENLRAAELNWTEPLAPKARADAARHPAPFPPPMPQKPLKYLPKEKKKNTLKSLLLLFSSSTATFHPLPTTAPLAAPGFFSTNQEQMSAGAVLKDPAVLDASHMLFIQRWRLRARLLVKPFSGGGVGWGVAEKKQTLQMPSRLFKKSYIYQRTFMSPLCHFRISGGGGFFSPRVWSLRIMSEVEYKVMTRCQRKYFLHPDGQE